MSETDTPRTKICEWQQEVDRTRESKNKCALDTIPEVHGETEDLESVLIQAANDNERGTKGR